MCGFWYVCLFTRPEGTFKKVIITPNQNTIGILFLSFLPCHTAHGSIVISIKLYIYRMSYAGQNKTQILGIILLGLWAMSIMLHVHPVLERKTKIVPPLYPTSYIFWKNLLQYICRKNFQADLNSMELYGVRLRMFF